MGADKNYFHKLVLTSSWSSNKMATSFTKMGVPAHQNLWIWMDIHHSSD